MKKNFLSSLFFAAIAVLIVAGCGNDRQTVSPREQALMAIRKNEAKMHETMELRQSVADSALDAYKSFIEQFPDDSLCPDFIFKSAEIETALQRYPSALAHYKMIVAGYPDYKLREESMFLEASLLDNYMDRDGDAQMIYQELLKEFSNGRYTGDARAAIQNLGKSDQELIEEFRKKNGEK